MYSNMNTLRWLIKARLSMFSFFPFSCHSYQQQGGGA